MKLPPQNADPHLPGAGGAGHNAPTPGGHRSRLAFGPGGKLSTRLLVAYAALVVVYFLLMTVPVHVLLRRDYVAQAAASFQAVLAQHADDLTKAAEKGDPVALDTLCQELNANFQGRVTLIDVDGDVVGDSMSARCLARAKPECIPAIQAQRRLALKQYLPLDDTVTIRLPIRLGARGPATVRLALPLQPVRAKLRQMTGLLVVTACGAMLLAIGIGLFVSRRIARPVEQMTHVAECIAAGDFACSPPPAGSDEIGRLSQALSHMQKSLSDSMQHLSKERNQALAIVQHLTDGVIVLDTDNAVIFANETATALLDSDGIAPGNPFRAPGPVMAAIDEARARGCESACELGDVRRDDRVVRVEVTPVRGADDQAPSVIVVLRDMTEARRAENLGRELVANASHELRTPLAVIGSSAETLIASAAYGSPQQREFLQIISRQAERLEKLVSETLQLSQLDSSVPPEPRRRASLGALVRDVMLAFAPAASRRGVDLSCADGAGEAQVDAFASTLTKGIANLVDNAIRYTPSGGIVTVAVETVDGTAAVLVRDTGPGIPPPEQARIFERFVRGRDTARNGVEGSGMGLAIVRRVAELHHGRVELESAPGRGSCFKLILPLAGEETVPPDA